MKQSNRSKQSAVRPSHVTPHHGSSPRRGQASQTRRRPGLPRQREWERQWWPWAWLGAARACIAQRRRSMWSCCGGTVWGSGGACQRAPPSLRRSLPCGPTNTGAGDCVFSERQRIYASWFDGYAKCLLPLRHMLEPLRPYLDWR